jgi:hypothetical protein
MEHEVFDNTIIYSSVSSECEYSLFENEAFIL